MMTRTAMMMIPSHDNHYDSVYDDDGYDDDNDDEEEDDDTLSDNVDPLGNNLLMHRVHKFSHLYTDIGQLLQNIIISPKTLQFMIIIQIIIIQIIFSNCFHK